MQLLLQSTWKVDLPADLLLAQQRAFNLIDLFQECSGATIPFACPFIFFGGTDHGFFLRPGYSAVGCSSDTIGTLVSQGWEDTTLSGCSPAGQLRGVDIEKTFPTTILNKVTCRFGYTRGGFNNAGHTGYALTVLNGASLVAQDFVPIGSMVDGDQVRELAFAPAAATTIILSTFSDFYAPTATGAVTVPEIVAYGEGLPIC